MTADYKLKILLVDDETEARAGLGHMLRSKGYEVVEVGTGAEALARAKGEWPALIILDIVLPDMLGTEVFERLRADPITKAIPVLLLTGKPGAAEKVPASYGSSDQVFEKPGRVDELMALVHQMLTGKK
jgi:CheY-like chemotaxis protein